MRKAQVSSTLVYMVAILIGFFVLLFVFSGFGKTLGAEAEKKNCQWSLLLSSITKAPITGQELLPPDCQLTKVEITKEELEQREKPNIKEIKRLQEENKIVFKHFTTKEKSLREYEMDRIIADEIKDCWETVWLGKMPIFSQWWSLLKCTEDEGCTCADGNKDTCGDVPSTIRDVIFNSEFRDPPIFCYICSRIKFTPAVQAEFEDNIIISLPEWMKTHPVPVDPVQRSYYEYTTDDVNKGIFVPEYKYTVDKPLAVVYSRVNVYGPTEFGQRIFGLIDPQKPTNTLSLIPFDEVSEQCTYVLG